MFTVIVVHKILVPLGVLGWPHSFTIFTGLLEGIIFKYSNRQSGQVASIQHSVSLPLSFNILNCHLSTTMKISSLTRNNSPVLFHWITSNYCWLLFRKQRKEEHLRNKQNTMKELFVPAPAFFLLPSSQYKGLEHKKTFLKASETGALWFITIRAVKQTFNTKLYWQEQFHEAVQLIWLKDFYQFTKSTGLTD